MNVDEAADLLETYVSKMNGVFTVGDLKYLSRTGRIKGSVAVVGNMLKIKPILRGSEDGYIVSYKNVRGRKAVLNELPHAPDHQSFEQFPSLSNEKFLLFPQCTFHNLCCMGSMWKNRWNYAWKEETVSPLFTAISEKYRGTAVVSLVAPFTEDCGLFRDRTKRSYPVRHGFRCSNRKKY